MKWMNRLKLMRGGKSLGLSALLIALVLLLMLGAQALEDRFALRRDYSFNGVTTQSAVSQRVLDALQHDVHVYALFTPGQEDMALIGLLERFQASSSRFSFSLENLALNPGLASTISSSLSDSQVSNDCLIVYSPATDRTRVLTGADYISQSYDPESGSYFVSGINYEKSLSEALVFVSTTTLPQLQLLTGHGELSATETAAMDSLLGRYNYALKRIDLRRQEVLDPAHPLLILTPQKDLDAAELAAIQTFAKAGGSLLITHDYVSGRDLPHFRALYRSYGFEAMDGMVIARAEDAGSYFESPAVLMPYMQQSEITLGMMDAGQTTLILAGSAAFKEPAEASAGQYARVVLRSGKAYLRSLSAIDGGIQQQPGDVEGSFPLALMADVPAEDGTRMRAFIIGNSSVFTDSWLQGNTYSAEFLLSVINYLSPGERIQLAISPKDAMRQPMRISSPWLVTLALVLLPALIGASALVMLLPRRRL